MVGDWFTYVAVGLLALRGPDGIFGVALVQFAHAVPQALASPLAGWLTDRADRRSLLVAASLGRGVITCAMAIAAAHDEIAWVEGLLFVRMAGAAFVAAPSRAMLPELVEGHELEPANRLLGTSWAVLFTLGVALGGVVTGAFGPTFALAIDAITFALSALVFTRLGPSRPALDALGGRALANTTLFADARAHPDRFRAALAKSPALFASGAAWVLLHAVIGGGAGVAYLLGALHACRGIGNAAGPWLFRRAGERRTVLYGALVTMAGALAIAAGPPAAWPFAALLWGVGVGATWVGATVWLQRVVPSPILGRYTGLDVGATSLASAGGGGLAALLSLWLEPLPIALVLCAGALALAAPLRSRATSVAAAAALGIFALVSPVSAQDAVRNALARRAVTETRFVHRELYSWTSLAQGRRLRAERVLLVAGAGDGAVRSPYQLALDELARGSGEEAELARLLTDHPALARRRYAWPTPYGTVTPRGTRSYGPVLIRMDIDAEALTVRFAPEEESPFSAVDASGAPVPLRVAIADPSRVGVVYHVRHSARLGAYREYIVHGRVARWSLATDAIRARVQEDVRLLRRLARALRVDRRRRSMAAAWVRPDGGLADLFASTMPFDTRRHRPSPQTLRALADRLARYRVRGPPLEVVP